jgi:hypothetical protein
MRISLAMLLAILATLTLGEPAQAQLDRCDDCNIMWDGEEPQVVPIDRRGIVKSCGLG